MSVMAGSTADVPLVPVHTFPSSKGRGLPTCDVNYDYYAPFWSFLAGALTGGIEAIVTYPIEYVKTHLQLQQLSHLHLSSSSSSSAHVYSGMWDCVKRTVRQHSPLGLYRGFVPVLLGSMPKQASRWAAYEWATETAKRITSRDGSVHNEVILSLPVLSVCGFFAGFVETLCAVGPTESVKTQLIHDSKQPFPRYHSFGTVGAVRLMLREKGFRRTFYSGVSATMVKQGLNQSLRFPVQKFVMDAFCSDAVIGPWHDRKGVRGEAEKEWMRRLREERRKNPFWNGLAGFFAGVLSVLITQPVDVIKTQVQSGTLHDTVIYNNRKNTSNRGRKVTWMMLNECGAPHRMGYMSYFRSIYHQRGVAGFYAGVIARSVHVGTHVALTFTIFPVIRRMADGNAGNKK
ncbi:putative citrate transporter [Trypanosoma cruzi]|uniref:Citrate transporter, putative n=2 Tax=Trypanosoma cruzi TaxID=5693 RepID=Q4DDW2_TRYCC|nr:citrate transporter, putative [Trypanosoma cruzi]EAN90706.1 citrate transporter, putative [Trypanosoma cruzi]PWV10764.1 putative citrate transporter [Trypanosoma cruzi]RNC47460.1 putative citrate transporter [Trypanosoma cruzi]|eukprot:XP_812557.1 citrate transporter [Trypanosoma cruzi strain CL Brener]